MIKSVIIADEIKNYSAGNLDNYQCYDCGGMIFYISKIMGVVHEVLDYGIVGYKDKNRFSLREYGWNIHCAECGNSREITFYEKDNLVCDFDDLDNADKEEIDYCLAQYNQKKSYIPRYNSMSVQILLKKLKEYDKK